ncbi:disease resistance protein Pik-1-like [Phragmites australis]|uniref:disease resistance protein Pik-1-like n=1 Tax=Phragmites australis TaxID=29695 RepID=UPI002D76D299|nr:disease resistance protein Pik-1-like [Phragmites australis]
MTKQKIVIRVSMPCEKSRSKAMALVARADGVSSMGIAGDERDRLEVVGDGVDTVCLVRCLRKKIGHAELLQVEEVKEKKPEEKPEDPNVVHQPPYWYPGYYHYHLPPSCSSVVTIW